MQKSILDTPILVLSPHWDDAVLSCGGLLQQHGDALVVTMCTAESEKPRTGYVLKLASVEERRGENRDAMEFLGCAHRDLDLLDAVDRFDSEERLYPDLSSLFGAVHPNDATLCTQIVTALAPMAEGRVLLAPLAIGAHVDHQLCAHAARRLSLQHTLSTWFYEDAPYVYADPKGKVTGDTALFAARRLSATFRGNFDVSIDRAEKEKAVARYPSQVKGLFGDLAGYRQLTQFHYESLGGELERFHALQFRR